MPEHIISSQVSFFRSLRGRLLILFLLVALVPLLLLGVILTNRFYRTHINQIEHEVNNMASFQAHAIETWLADRKRDMNLFAQQPEIQSMERSVVMPTVLKFYEGWGIYEDLIVLRPTGDTVFDTAGAGLNLGDRDYFQAAMRGETVASDILFSRADGQPIIVFAAPVYGENESIVGVVAAVMPATHITDLVAMTWQGESGDAYLINRDGLFITNSRFTTEMREAGVVEQFTARELQIDTAVTRAVLMGGHGTLAQTKNFREHDVLAGYYYIEEQGWGLIIEQDRSEILAELFRFQILIGIMLGITMLVVAIIAFLTVRWFTTPIVRLSGAAREIANGNLDLQFKVTGQTELTDLGNAFNDMTTRLKNLLAAAEKSRAYLEVTIAQYMVFVEQVASGNLRERLALADVGGEDDDLTRLGRSLNSMVDSLAEMASQIRETANAVSSSATEILSATTQQIAAASEQDASVTQTVATVEEISTTVKQTAERADSVAEASRQSMQVSQEGQESVVASMNGMQAVRDRVDDIAHTILALSERTQQIGEIISTVNDIAEQSKLLALNASIEAARAGEEGRGFSVVAQEVRQLAEESREATSRISAILHEIQQATNTAVMVTEEGSKEADAGGELVVQAGEAIQNLSQTIEQAAQAATQIAASTQQQSNGMEQLVAAMAAIKQATTQTAASTRQAEISAQTLAELARQMEDVVARYQL